MEEKEAMRQSTGYKFRKNVKNIQASEDIVDMVRFRKMQQQCVDLMK